MREIKVGDVFDTSAEAGCIATLPLDDFGNFEALDSDGVTCAYNISMITNLHPSTERHMIVGARFIVELRSHFPGSWPCEIIHTGAVDGIGNPRFLVKLDQNPNPYGESRDASGRSWREWNVTADQLTPEGS